MPGVELESSPCHHPRIEDMDRGDRGKGANFAREPDTCNMARTFEVQDAGRFRDVQRPFVSWIFEGFVFNGLAICTLEAMPFLTVRPHCHDLKRCFVASLEHQNTKKSKVKN